MPSIKSNVAHSKTHSICRSIEKSRKKTIIGIKIANTDPRRPQIVA